MTQSQLLTYFCNHDVSCNPIDWCFCTWLLELGTFPRCSSKPCSECPLDLLSHSDGPASRPRSGTNAATLLCRFLVSCSPFRSLSSAPVTSRCLGAGESGRHEVWQRWIACVSRVWLKTINHAFKIKSTECFNYFPNVSSSKPVIMSLGAHLVSWNRESAQQIPWTPSEPAWLSLPWPGVVSGRDRSSPTDGVHCSKLAPVAVWCLKTE